MTMDRDAVPSAAILPDGSAFAVASFPLPKDHWLYAERTYAKNDQIEPDELPEPILTHAQRATVVAAVRYAVRGATMCGKEDDFDPDALVQNAVYALCGPFGVAQPVEDWRADVQKVRDSLDPEDWCGNESMIAALDRALAQPIAPTAEQAQPATQLSTETVDKPVDRVGGPTAEQAEGATTDEVIELAVALEQKRALHIVAAVRKQGFSKSASAIPTQAESVFDLACEEIEHRLLTETWELAGVTGPLPAASDGDQEVGS